MERRIAKVNISAAGGTACEGAKTCKVTLPNLWLAKLGIDEANRQMELCFDGTRISITPYLDFDRFLNDKKEQGHELYLMRFYDSDRLCSTIVADFTDHTIRVRNESVELIKTAFGKKKLRYGGILSTFLKNAVFLAPELAYGIIWMLSA